MSFGTELWDQIKLIEVYTEQGCEQMESINQLMKGLSLAELEYGKSLQRIIRPFKEEMRKSAERNDKIPTSLSKTIAHSMNAWSRLCSEIETIGSLHIAVAEIVSEERKVVKDGAKEIEISQKEIKVSHAQLKCMIDQMERNHQAFNRGINDLDHATLVYKKSLNDINMSKKESEKIKIEYDRQVLALQDSSSTYRKSIGIIIVDEGSVNELKNQIYGDSLPKTLNVPIFLTQEIQKVDEVNRINFCKDSLLRFCTTIQSLSPKTSQSIECVNEALAKISAQTDSQSLIEALKTDESIPADFCFSDTQDLLKKKIGLKSSNSGHELGDLESLQNIISLPPKQSRKRAVDKIKSLDKEIAEVEKQRQGIDILVTATKNPSSPKSVQKDLEDHRMDVELKINTLLVKKHKFYCHVAQLDGKPTPIPPTLFGKGVGESPSSMSYAKLVSATSTSSIYIPISNSPPLISIPPTVKSPLSLLLKQVVVLYDFTAAANASQEISVLAGDVLSVIQVKADGWTECETLTGSTGIVPSSYLDEVASDISQ